VLTFCSHQEELTGIDRDRKGVTGIEIVGVLGKTLKSFVGSPLFHAGDRGSNPLGDANTIKHLTFSCRGTRWVLFPNCSRFFDPAAVTCRVSFF
jgi:hypothetical protein